MKQFFDEPVEIKTVDKVPFGPRCSSRNVYLTFFYTMHVVWLLVCIMCLWTCDAVLFSCFFVRVENISYLSRVNRNDETSLFYEKVQSCRMDQAKSWTLIPVRPWDLKQGEVKLIGRSLIIKKGNQSCGW